MPKVAQPVEFRGFKFDQRTVDMILWAEKKAGFKFKIAQGSYSTGVAASAGTHDGGGAADFSVRLMLPKKREKMLNALKDAGFAAWYRLVSDGFDSAHVHAVAIGCPDLAPLAKSQVLDYDKGKSGLKGHAADPTYRPSPKVKFDAKKGQPVSRETAPKAAPVKTTAKVEKAPAKKPVAKKAAPAKKAPSKPVAKKAGSAKPAVKK